MLELASIAGNKEIVDALLAKGTDSEVSFASLSAAAQYGHADVVQMLLEHGDYPNRVAMPPQYFGNDSKDDGERVLDLLIERGLDLHKVFSCNEHAR